MLLWEGWGYCVPQLGVGSRRALAVDRAGVKIFYIRKKGVA